MFYGSKMQLDQVIQFIKTLTIEDATIVMEAARERIELSKEEGLIKLFSSEEQDIHCSCVCIFPRRSEDDGEREYCIINFKRGEDTVSFHPYVTKTALGYFFKTQVMNQTWGDIDISSVSLFPGSSDVEDMEFMNIFEDKLGSLLSLVKQCMMLIHKNRNALHYQLLETGWMDKQGCRVPTKDMPDDDDPDCATPSSSDSGVREEESFATRAMRQMELESEARVLRGSYKEDKTAIQGYLKHYDLKLSKLEEQRLKRLLTDTDKEIQAYSIGLYNTRAVSWQDNGRASQREMRVGFRVGEDQFEVIFTLLYVSFYTEYGHRDEYASQERYTSFVSTIEDSGRDIVVAPAFSGDWFSEKRSVLIGGQFLDHCRASFPNRYEKVWRCINLIAQNLDDIMF